MTTYAQQCPACGLAFEHRRPMAESGTQPPCPSCGATARRVYTPPVTDCHAFGRSTYTAREPLHRRRARSEQMERRAWEGRREAREGLVFGAGKSTSSTSSTP